MGKYTDQTTKDQFIADVKGGLKVSEAATKYDIHIKTAYGILSRQADNSGMECPAGKDGSSWTIIRVQCFTFFGVRVTILAAKDLCTG